MERKEKKNQKRVFIFIMALLAALVIGFSYVGYGIWREYRNAIIDNQKEQMLLTAQVTGRSLETSFEEYLADLGALCMLERTKNTPETGGDRSGFYRDYIKAHGNFVHDLFLEDEAGRVIKSEKGLTVMETCSVLGAGTGWDITQSKLSDGGFYLIFRQRVPGGALCLAVDEAGYYEKLISDIRLGTNGYVVIKDSRGTILMHPEEEQWGIDVIAGRQKLYPQLDLSSLEEMIEKQNAGLEGVSEYYSYWWTKEGFPRVKKISAYSPVEIGDDFLTVSAVIDYNDIYVPVAEGFFKILMVFLGVTAVVLMMAAYLAKLLLEKQKDTAEIAYLRDLNELLKEMHRSEETIAHQQRLQIMGTMTGGIAHEFNNLLTPIMGYADLMLAELPKNSDLHESASEIYEASVKAKEIIQQISSLSRKNMETAYKDLPAEKLVRRALKMVKSICPANVRLTEKLSLGQESILGNETQMNQVILNICVNAVHAIGHGEGNLTVTGTVVPRGELAARDELLSVPETWSRYVRLDIADDGCGMSRETLGQIFDPFFTTKKGGAGTGLGLSLAEQIVRSHKGIIFAESEPGKGSVFHIYLPVNEKKGEELSADGKGRENGLRLLIVDDNAKVLQLLEKNFARLGVPTTTCTGQEEARQLLKKQDFDVLVVDGELPEVGGVDFCMAVQGEYPEMLKLVLVDRVTKETVEAKQRKIIDDYIEKPVSDSAILQAVRMLKTEI